eukprot:scaffold4891_cov140-Cylindrotheca_fusiformis.AAC.1
MRDTLSSFSDINDRGSMSDDGSTSLLGDPSDAWDSTDDVPTFHDAPMTANNDFQIISRSGSTNGTQPIRLSALAMGNKPFKNFGYRSFLHVESENNRPLHILDDSLDFQNEAPRGWNFVDEGSSSLVNFEAEQNNKLDNRLYRPSESLNFQDVITSTHTLAHKKEARRVDRNLPTNDLLYQSEGSLTLDNAAPSRMGRQQDLHFCNFESKKEYHLLGASDGSLQGFGQSSGEASYSKQLLGRDRKRTITFEHSLSASSGEDPMEDSLRTVDIFATGRNIRSSKSPNMAVPDGSEDDDSAFVSEEDETNDLDKEIKRQFVYYLAGMGLFYLLGKLLRCLCKLCGKGNEVPPEINTATSATRDSMTNASGTQLVFGTVGCGAATTAVSSTVVTGMAIRAAENTAASAALASGGMVNLVEAGGAVAVAGVSGVTVGTVATVVTVATSAAVI